MEGKDISSLHYSLQLASYAWIIDQFYQLLQKLPAITQHFLLSIVELILGKGTHGEWLAFDSADK